MAIVTPFNARFLYTVYLLTYRKVVDTRKLTVITFFNIVTLRCVAVSAIYCTAIAHYVYTLIQT